MVHSCLKGFFLFPIAIFLPPLAIFIDKGCGNQLFANCLLTILFLIPGIINALLILYYFEDGNDYKRESFDRTVNINEDIHYQLKNYNIIESITIV
uniref:UPF0057-domain-containing protein n=1 Tax=Strongyloides venezuelensis TaxID=75913 RepID=A0A0K0FK75_STRVS